MTLVPVLPDEGLRRRLTARFGAGVQAWLDRLPDVLSTLAQRWQLDCLLVVPRGSMSAVFACRTIDGDAILKVSPDRERLATEATALRHWSTRHPPAVLAGDEAIGALLIEAINPGTALIETPTVPPIDRIADLLTALHSPSGARTSGFLRCRSDRRTCATPAVDPAPCIGDPAFDAVDLLLWRASDVESVADRAGRLAVTAGLDPARLCDRLRASAAMVGLDAAGLSADDPHVAVCVALADGDR